VYETGFVLVRRAKRVRGWLAANARLERLEDFDGFMVFADAGIATTIVVFDTTQPHGEHEVEVRRLPSGRYSTSQVIEGVRNDTTPFEAFDPKAKLSDRPWHFHNPYATAPFSRIDGRGDPLIQVCELGQGMQTGANSVFGKLTAADVVDHDLPPELLKPRARNSDIDRFYIADSGEFLLYLEDVPNFRALPQSVRDYLRIPANEKKLRGRAAFKRGNCEWWRYTWPLHKDLHDQPRLVCPYRTGHRRFALDENFSWMTLTDTTVAFKRAGVKEDVRYLLGLLSTRLLTYRFRGLAKLTGPDMWEAFDNSIRDLPIRRINFEDATERGRHDFIAPGEGHREGDRRGPGRAVSQRPVRGRASRPGAERPAGRNRARPLRHHRQRGARERPRARCAAQLTAICVDGAGHQQGWESW
jgi:hypothetical protein